MLTILSPAKKLLPTDIQIDALGSLQPTKPMFLEKTMALVSTLKNLSVSDIANLLHISKDLALLNYQRYQVFNCDNPTAAMASPAVFVFHGDVYQSLCAASWDNDTISFSQDHLVILSGLYGLLKPLDLIQAYRLEMGTRLANTCGKNLYDFWQTAITNELHNRLEHHNTPILINLASREYILAVDPARLKCPMLTIHFKEERNNQYKIIGIFAKKARGAMANYIMQHKIDRPEAIKEFTGLGYRFCEKSSDSDNYNFIRDTKENLAWQAG